MADDEPETLAARFVRLRAQRKLTQEELSRQAGVTKGAVQLIEAGTTGKPQRKTLISYAQVLGVSVDYLLWGETRGTSAHEERVNQILSTWEALPEPEQRVLETLGEALLTMRRTYEERGVNFQAGHAPNGQSMDSTSE